MTEFDGAVLTFATVSGNLAAASGGTIVFKSTAGLGVETRGVGVVVAGVENNLVISALGVRRRALALALLGSSVNS